MNIERGRILNDYIENNKRQYVIPVYQRNYEWSKEQCTKLFEDIVNISKTDYYHFCGSIISKFLSDKGNIMSYVVIDGQQRLTTIYILLKALLDCSESNKDKDTLNEVLFNYDKYDEYAIDVQSKLKLKPIKTDNEQLYLLMSNEYDKIDKNSGIWKNYEIFKSLIKLELSKGNTVEHIYDGLKKLTCAQIRLDPEDNAQEIFDRINSTGLPLSLADKIRNFVLMTDANQESLYESYWLPIEKLLNTDELKSFFVDFINFNSVGQVKESDAYDKFREIYTTGGYTNESMLSKLLRYAKLYHNFIYADCKDYSDTTNYYLACLQKIKQTTVFIFLFSVFTDFEDRVINADELDMILHFLLGYSVKRGICEIGSNSLRGLYKTLYSRVFINERNKEHYYDAIVSFIEQLNTKDAIPSNDRFRTDLKEKNLYPKKDFCKFLLSSIENDTVDSKTGLLKKKKEQIITDSLSIEHVMPQNENVSKSWRDMLGENWQYIHDRYLHTLGNLTITGYNSELGDKSYAEKQQMMDDIDAKAVLLNKEINDSKVWNEKTITDRAERLADIVVAMYEYAKPEAEISFVDPEYHEYSCEDENESTNKKPAYFVFQGERTNVSSFAEMKELMIEKLYEINPYIIEKMAEENSHVYEGAEFALFSYDPEKVRWGSKGKELMIKNTNICEGYGFSASTIIYIIRALLNMYDIDLNDFLYSAKATTTVANDETIFLKWLKEKSKEGRIHINPEECNRSYYRFTSEKMSSYILDTKEKSSDWSTSNHYFYEMNVQGNKVKIKLSLNSTGASEDNLKKFEELNDICVGRSLKKNWTWRTLFATEFRNIDDMTDDQIAALLEDLYSQYVQFEDELFTKIA